MSRARLLTMSLLAALVLLGVQQPAAAGEPSEPADEQSKTETAQAVKTTANELFQTHAEWIPDDTNVLMISNLTLEFDLLFSELADAERQIVKREFARELLQDAGEHFAGATAVIYALSPDAATIILEGEFEVPKDLESTEIDGKTVYDLSPMERNLREVIVDRNVWDSHTYMVILEEPAGAVIRVESAEEGSKRQDWPRKFSGLAKSKRMERFGQLTGLAPNADLLAVIDGAEDFHKQAARNIRRVPDVEVQSSSPMVLGAGDRIHFGFLGGANELAVTESAFDARVDSLRKQSREEAVLPEDSLERVHIRALFSVYLGGFEKEKTDSSLVYSFPLPEDKRWVPYLHSELRSMGNRKALADLLQVLPNRRLAIVAASPIEAGTIAQPALFKSTIVFDNEVPPSIVLSREDLDRHLGKPIQRALERGVIVVASDFETSNE